MQIKITDIKDTPITGVNVRFTGDCSAYKENWFEWTAYDLVTEFQTGKIMNGLLEGWHHTPNFDVIEYHVDAEQFIFIAGTALMLFIDIADGKPVMESAQLVRVPTGVQLDIAPGKGHFVAVAEDDFFKAIVTSPVQDAPRIPLPEMIEGVC